MPVQSVTFSRSESPTSVNDGDGWTKTDAESWLKDHGYRSYTSRETSGQLRFRQFNPRACKDRSYQVITRNLPTGVQLVECQKK